jgi:hypothetical protein
MCRNSTRFDGARASDPGAYPGGETGRTGGSDRTAELADRLFNSSDCINNAMINHAQCQISYTCDTLDQLHSICCTHAQDPLLNKLSLKQIENTQNQLVAQFTYREHDKDKRS